MNRPFYIIVLFSVLAVAGFWGYNQDKDAPDQKADELHSSATDTEEPVKHSLKESKLLPDSSIQDDNTISEVQSILTVSDAYADDINAETESLSHLEVEEDTAAETLEPACTYETIEVCTDSKAVLPEPVEQEETALPEEVNSDLKASDKAVADSADVFEKADNTEEEMLSPLAVALDSREFPAVSDKPEEVAIPELDWPDYTTRQRREMTLEIAQEYPRGKHVPRFVTNTVFDVGEKLKYSIDYGFYRAGTATLTVVGTESVNGDDCYHIQSKANSNKFISSFYKVRDQVNSYIDMNGLFSRRFEKNLREGSYESDRYVDFYHDRLIALNTKESAKVKEIPLYVQDILSSLYVLRTFDLKVGEDEFIDVYADGKVYPLRIIIHKIETVKVPAGKYKCYKVEPVLESEGLFRSKGRLLVWLSLDNNKIPVKMTSKIPIGSVGANLETFTYGETE